MLAVLEGGAADPALAELATQLLAQRATTAAWLVDHLARIRPLRDGCSRQDAIDTCWVLMDPAVFDRLTRHRGWTAERYGRWFADALARVLVDPETAVPQAAQEPTT